MNEQTRREWDALREEFDNRRSELIKGFNYKANMVEDRHRQSIRDIEDSRHKFMAELKAIRRRKVDEYIYARRELNAARHAAMSQLEQERQTAYSKFKTEHADELTEAENN